MARRELSLGVSRVSELHLTSSAVSGPGLQGHHVDVARQAPLESGRMVPWGLLKRKGHDVLTATEGDWVAVA